MFYKKGFHHAYLGIGLMIIGFVFILFIDSPEWISDLMVLFGMYLYVDDYYQHRRNRQEPLYRSPWHRLYMLVLSELLISKNFHWLGDMIVKLNIWADKLFGGGE